MTMRSQDHRWLPAMTAALLCVLILGGSLPTAGVAQAGPEFSVTVDPMTSCAADAPVTGTVTLTGLIGGYGFSVQLRGGGEALDDQVFAGNDRHPDGTYGWSVAGLPSTPHDILELSFTLYDGEGDPIRSETVALNPDCDLYHDATPAPPILAAASPGTVIPALTPAMAQAGADDGRESNPVLVAGFAGATVLVLTALAFLDRRPEP